MGPDETQLVFVPKILLILPGQGRLMRYGEASPGLPILMPGLFLQIIRAAATWKWFAKAMGPVASYVGAGFNRFSMDGYESAQLITRL